MIKLKILVTGGAGFIGSALCRYLLQQQNISVINLDALTYAANLQALTSIEQDPRYQFIQADICDAQTVQQILQQHQPDAIMHLAAESHVDRSLSGPAAFVHTNIIGTYTLLEASRHYWQQLNPAKQAQFRFLHVSTDEVFGDLADSGVHLNKKLFTENHAYAPSSPYSASN